MAPPKRSATDATKKRRRGANDDNDDTTNNNDVDIDKADDVLMKDDDDDDDEVMVVDSESTATATQQKVKRARKSTAMKSTTAVPAPIVSSQNSNTVAASTSTGTPHGAGVPRQPSRAIPTVDTLKMPSAHTPGKQQQQRRPSMTTTMITPSIQIASTPSVPSIDTVPAPTAMVGNRLVLDTPTPAPTTATTETTEQVETVSEDDTKNKENDDSLLNVDNETKTPQQQSTKEFLQKILKSIVVLKQLQSPLVWFLLLMIPQMIFFQPLWSFVIATSDSGLVMYKGMYESIFPSSLSSIVPSTENISSTISGTMKSLNDTKNSMVSSITMQKEIDTIKGLLNELTTSQQTLKELQQSLETEIEKNFQTILETDDNSDMSNLIKTMKGTATELNSLSSLIKNTNVADHYTAQELLLIQSIRDKLVDESKLVDLSKLELWDLSTATVLPKSDDDCSTNDEDEEVAEDDDDKTKGISLENVNKWLNDIVENTIEQIQGIVSHEHDSITAIQAWIQHETKLIVDTLHQRTKTAADMLTVDGDEKSTVPTTLSPIDRFRQIIQEQLEIEHADQSGRIDYAMIANGATVVTTGLYKTSRSLIQDMPLLNKLAHSLQVRFYGYGPQIALTPTFPMNALGQCWAMATPAHTTSDTDSLGMLTINLAKAVYVHEVVMEHPYYEITDRTETAPRIFTVYGYEDTIITDASQEYYLGTFEYKVTITDDDNNNTDRLQTFAISSSTIPKLSTIRLLIESNWGGDYTCLYRFRVHGSEDEVAPMDSVAGESTTEEDEEEAVDYAEGDEVDNNERIQVGWEQQ
jgi:Sad1 / UNC-like C-terminal